MRFFASLVLAAVVASFVAACTRAAVGPDRGPSPGASAHGAVSAAAASASPSASPSSGPSAVAQSRPVAVGSFSAWTDPAALAALAASCHVTAAAREPNESDRDPLQCQLPYQQSCAFDPCFDKLQECHEACSKSCGACDQACATTCDGCKADCKDGACALGCAKTTGDCKQGCLKAVDHCGTADCAKAMKACYVEAMHTWKAHGCSCAKIRTCTEPCMTTESFDTCKARCGPRFPGCELLYCVMGSEPGR